MPEEKKETIVFGANDELTRSPAYQAKDLCSSNRYLNALKGADPVGGGEGNHADFARLLKKPAPQENEHSLGRRQPRPPGSPILESPYSTAVAANRSSAFREAPKEEPAPLRRKRQTSSMLDIDGMQRMPQNVFSITKSAGTRLNLAVNRMKFEDLLYKNVRQRVPIIPEKFRPLFRSLLLPNRSS